MNKKTNSSFTRSEEQKKKQCMLTVDVDVYAMEEHLKAQNEVEVLKEDLDIKTDDYNDKEKRLCTIMVAKDCCQNKKRLQQGGRERPRWLSPEVAMPKENL